MKPDSKTLLGLLLSVLIPALLVGAGYWAGRYVSRLPYRQQLAGRAVSETLGSLLTEERQADVALTYADPAAALAAMDNISWSVPNIPAPFVGSLPAPGQHANAYINAQQLRYDQDVAMPKPAGTFRIFLTGGSTAFGSGAPSQASTIGSVLARLLAERLTPATSLRYEVMTAANPAWASTQERVFIENRLSELAPDLVISLSGNNDVHWAQLGRNVLWFRAYDDDIFLALVSHSYTDAGQPPIPDTTDHAAREVAPALIAQRLIKNVELSGHVLQSAGAGYLFVLQPTLAVTRKPLTAREQVILEDADRRAAGNQRYFQDAYRAMDAALTAWAASPASYLNLATMFDGDPAGEELFLDSYHFGDRGYARIAEALFTKIEPLLTRQ